MNYGNIKFYDVANGEGVRTSLFVSGCRNNCEYCFNKETWDFNYGSEFTEETINIILKSIEPNYINGLSILGGEPMEEENQKEILKLVKTLKEKYSNKNIWLYTGYLYDKDLQKNGKKYTDFTDELISFIDIIIDGKFVESLKNVSLQFRGSSNQRIIDVQESLKTKQVVHVKRFK